MLLVVIEMNLRTLVETQVLRSFLWFEFPLCVQVYQVIKPGHISRISVCRVLLAIAIQAESHRIVETFRSPYFEFELVSYTSWCERLPTVLREKSVRIFSLHRYEPTFFRRFTFCKSISPGNSVFYTRQGITLPLDDYSYRRRSLVLHSVSPNLAAWTPKLNIPALVRPHPLYILLRVSRELCFW